MIARFATQSEINEWNKNLINNPDKGNVFGSYEFAMQKETGGYKARFLVVDNIYVTVLEKNTPMFGRLWYLPKGPGVLSTKDLFMVLEAIDKLAESYGVFAIRAEPELDNNTEATLQKYGLLKARPIIPNPSTIILDISDDLNKVLASLPQKGRHAIKRAERDGVTVKLVKSNENNCKIMYKLLSDTAKGQFGIRSFEYYKTFWKRFESAGFGQLFFAYYENQIVVGAYAVVFGEKSTYKDGASIKKKTAYGASHFLQWEVIKWAKSKGSLLHDLCGSPPSDEISNPDHKHYGIGLFKTAFNKTVTDYVGCYDYVIQPNKYKLWIHFLEKVAHRLHYYKHHDSYY